MLLWGFCGANVVVPSFFLSCGRDWLPYTTTTHSLLFRKHNEALHVVAVKSQSCAVTVYYTQVKLHKVYGFRIFLHTMPPLHALVIIFVLAASLTIPWYDKPSKFLTQCFVDFLQACRFLFQQVWVIIPTSFIIVCTLIDRPVESMRSNWSLSKFPPTKTDDGVSSFCVISHMKSEKSLLEVD